MFDMAMACSKNLRHVESLNVHIVLLLPCGGGADIIFQSQGLLPLSGKSTLSEQINPAR